MRESMPMPLLLSVVALAATGCPRSELGPTPGTVDDMGPPKDSGPGWADPGGDVLGPADGEDGAGAEAGRGQEVGPDVGPGDQLPPAPSCIQVNPASVNFGGKLVGAVSMMPLKISCCGDFPLLVYGIGMQEGSSPDFDVDLSMMDHVPTAEDPVVVAPGEAVQVGVRFVPDEENPVGEDGELVLDEGVIRIDSNAVAAPTDVPVQAAGVCINCPTAVIKCQEGDEVHPGTTLHLFGDESYAPNGSIQKWEWSVEQLYGCGAAFIPSYTFPNPIFEVNVPGVYTFYLTVYDQTNSPSCFPAKYEVAVFEKQAIRVELSWDVPGMGDGIAPRELADLDLHFVHPWAGGPDLDGDGAPDGWYDVPFACFWFNPHPNWGSYDPSVDDDPELDEHDGGESVVLEVPENVIYKVGVHYFQGSGPPATATVRVLVYNQVVYESPGVTLEPLDLWDVLTIEWPTAKVKLTKEDGDWKITPKYQNPYFVGPW
ncbi:MAG: hypothetical protein FJ109_13815 [Deltaproteobacteria bacterium]|nr:hypothetical protein [Deltaproteobacteria bacterium]